MGSARKYLALALAACQTKHYEEAGVFLAQAAQEEDAADLAKELGADEEVAKLGNTEGELAVSSDESDTCEDDAEKASTFEGDDEWEEEGEDEESISSTTRRKTTTMFHIGKIMAAAMSVSSDDDADEGNAVDNESDADPDFPGEALVPASFSSVKVKSIAVKSPVRMKAED